MDQTVVHGQGSGREPEPAPAAGPLAMPAVAADPIAAGLEVALADWRAGGDERALRRALLRVLAELE